MFDRFSIGVVTSTTKKAICITTKPSLESCGRSSWDRLLSGPSSRAHRRRDVVSALAQLSIRFLFASNATGRVVSPIFLGHLTSGGQLMQPIAGPVGRGAVLNAGASAWRWDKRATSTGGVPLGRRGNRAQWDLPVPMRHGFHESAGRYHRCLYVIYTVPGLE